MLLLYLFVAFLWQAMWDGTDGWRWDASFALLRYPIHWSPLLLLTVACLLYSAHRLKRENLGLSNTRTFVSSISSLCHIGVLLTGTLTADLTLLLAASFVATWHNYLEQLLIAVIMMKKLLLHFNPRGLYIFSRTVFFKHVYMSVFTFKSFYNAWRQCAVSSTAMQCKTVRAVTGFYGTTRNLFGVC